MRKVCRLAREVLDIAAAAIKPGVTTDYIDEIVHKACIERDVYLTHPHSSEFYHTRNEILMRSKYSPTPPHSTTTSFPNPSAPPSTKSSATVSPTSASSSTATF